LYTVTLRQPWVVEDEIPTGRRPQKLPNVLSPEEVAAFLDAVENQQYRVILTVCYAAGLRVSEAVRLKPAAIDSRRMVIRVEAGKGREDRYVMLSPRLCQLSRLLSDDVSAILPRAQAVSRMPRAIAALRMCCQRRVAAETCWRMRDRQRRKFRSSSWPRQ